MDKWKILVVEDDAFQREIIQAILADEGFAVKCAEDGERAVVMFAKFSPDVVLCDLKLPDMDGTEVMRRLAYGDRLGHEFILFTAHGTVESAVDAIKQGAFDYVPKPVDREKLIIITQRACNHLALVRENRQLKNQLTRPFTVAGIIGKHPKMQKVIDFVQMVGPLGVTVLITGETGTGKDLIARAIHSLSPRNDRTFQAINCAAMPETLLESELFGYEKGAFTGAFQQRHGLIERCDAGTLFLDEIGDLPIGPQAKLLRFLEAKKIRRIGGHEELGVDVRLIAATNKKLDDEIKNNRFREDLFYRFRGFIVQLPPLRERASDIYLLSEYFIEKYNLLYSKQVRGITEEALRALMQYSWPGNVRQLDAVMEKAVLLAHGDKITPADLDLPSSAASSAGVLNFEFPPQGISLEEIEKQVIVKAMEQSGGCIASAAKLLQTTYRTVEYRVKKFGIDRLNPPNG